MLLSQGIVLGQLIGQALDVRQQMLDRYRISTIPREFRNELLQGIVEFELTPVEEGHGAATAMGLEIDPEQEHCVLVSSFSKRGV